MDVEHPTAVLTGTAARDALDQQLGFDVELHHGIERLPDACQHAIEALSLQDRAREPIEDEPAAGVGFGKPLAHHTEHGRIVDELAGIHDGLGATTQFGTVAHMGAQQVSCRDLRDTMALDEALGLRALAGTGRTEENDSHERELQASVHRNDRDVTANGTRPFPAGQMLRYPRLP